LTKLKDDPKLPKIAARPLIPAEIREASMSITVKIGEAKARLSELIAKVEAGEDIVIQRGNEPVARLVPLDIERRAVIKKAIEDIRAFRARAKPVTMEEIIAWKHEGHRY
jgi:prevent-host-death family protein